MDREQFLKACDNAKTRIHKVNIDGIGETFFRDLNDVERVDGWDSWIAPKGKVNDKRVSKSRVRCIVLSVCNEQGDRILGDSDMDAISALPARTVSQMAEIALSCCGVNDDDIDEIIKKKSPNSSETTDVG